MKIRIMGTRDEAEEATRYFSQFLGRGVISVSAPYANRGNSVLYRIYIETDTAPFRISQELMTTEITERGELLPW